MLFSEWKIMPVKLKNKIQRVRKSSLGRVNESNKKVLASFAKDKIRIIAVNAINPDRFKPILIRKW